MPALKPFKCLRVSTHAQVLTGMCTLLTAIHYFPYFRHSGSRITEQLQEEFKTWDGGRMVGSGFLFVEGGFILAKALG